MLRSGAEYLEGIRDGRKVYVGRELVTDITKHPAFQNSARSFATLFDNKKLPEHIDTMSYEENGERFSSWYLLARNKDDLRKRAGAHKMLARWSHGLLGRSPDHVASFITGLCMMPEIFENNRAGDFREQPQGLRQESAELSRLPAEEGPVCFLCSDQPARRA